MRELGDLRESLFHPPPGVNSFVVNVCRSSESTGAISKHSVLSKLVSNLFVDLVDTLLVGIRRGGVGRGGGRRIRRRLDLRLTFVDRP